MKNDTDSEIPKHLKKKKSSTSKSHSKSKHKHEYIDCLLVEKDSNYPHKSSCCEICGKIGEVAFIETVRMGDSRFCRTLNADEVYEKYKDLEKVYVDSVWQKYIVIEDQRKEDINEKN